MPTTNTLLVKKLRLDLSNFRTVKQENEVGAIHAMISINPDWFWALTESLLQDGYHPTENIIVLKGDRSSGHLCVKEGNRRVAALKIALGYVSCDSFEVPSHIKDIIATLPKTWKTENKHVPCAIYEPHEAEAVDRIVTLTHGKGEKAGRDNWNAIARARHNREKGGVTETGLDLLEKYLKNGSNVTPQQSERWSGDYPLSVLDEAIKRLAPRFGVANTRELADKYPSTVSNRTILEQILNDVGLGTLTFETIRNKTIDFGQNKYGLPAPAKECNPPSIPGEGGKPAPTPAGPGSGGAPAPAPKKKKAVSLNDPRSVMRTLRAFHPKGNNRDKVVTLLEEARKLKIHLHPHAFCFLLRSMFEISAKAYCVDHASSGGPSATKAGGEDRTLVDILRDVTSHLTKNNTDKQMTKTLHGAMTEIAKSEGILSVTSLNQLVHSPKFSVNETHICSMFGNVFPLLDAMNR
jgi:hypothetical protein